MHFMFLLLFWKLLTSQPDEQAQAHLLEDENYHQENQMVDNHLGLRNKAIQATWLPA